MKKNLCVGHSAYDITYLLDEFPKENKKYKARARNMIGGGPAGNAAYLLGLYGLDISHITTLGNDLYGELIIEELNTVGVDTSEIIKCDEYSTPCSIIISNSENGSRTIINHRNKNLIKKDWKPSSAIKPDFILLDGHELEVSLKVLDTYTDSITVLDAGTYKEETVILSKKVDYFICSEDFALSYSGYSQITKENYEKLFEKLEKLNNKTIVVTLGERGCLYKKNNKVMKMDAFKVDAVDTTGAGDIFHGAFVYGLNMDMSVEENLEFSSACAALSVEQLGGRNSIPDLEKIKKLIKSRH